MTTQYANPWHKPGQPQYGPPMYSTDAKGVTYRGYTLYKVKKKQVDIVKDDICLHQVCTLAAAQKWVREETRCQ